MKLSRDVTRVIRYLMDEWLPPVLRDSPLMMKPLMKIFAGDKAKSLYHFKESAVTEEDFVSRFVSSDAHGGRETMGRQTDINKRCLERLLRDVAAEDIRNVLDAGCGGGFISEKIAEIVPDTTGVDIRPDIGGGGKRARYVKGCLEDIPFPDNHFDCVVCSHCIEHTLNIGAAVRELRRVARRRLIIVTPKQRPYYATFDTHLQFFPYPHSLRIALQAPPNSVLEVLSGDFYYVEILDER